MPANLCTVRTQTITVSDDCLPANAADCQSDILDGNSELSTVDYTCQPDTVHSHLQSPDADTCRHVDGTHENSPLSAVASDVDVTLDNCVESILGCSLPQEQFHVRKMPKTAKYTVLSDTLQKC